jgi:hypothetical protein
MPPALATCWPTVNGSGRSSANTTRPAATFRPNAAAQAQASGLSRSDSRSCLVGETSARDTTEPTAPAKTIRPIMRARCASGNISPAAYRLRSPLARAMPISAALTSRSEKRPCKIAITPRTAPNAPTE